VSRRQAPAALSQLQPTERGKVAEVYIPNRVVQTVPVVIWSVNMSAECKFQPQQANTLKIEIKLHCSL
jgi:hypothetical protein